MRRLLETTQEEKETVEIEETYLIDDRVIENTKIGENSKEIESTIQQVSAKLADESVNMVKNYSNAVCQEIDSESLSEAPMASAKSNTPDTLDICLICPENGGKCNLCRNEMTILENTSNASQGQKMAAEKMLTNTAKKLAHLDIGSCVLLPVDKIDRGPSDLQNLICVITDYKNDVYQVGCSAGRIKSWFNRPDLISTKEQFFTIDNVPNLFVSKREAIQALSLAGGQGYLSVLVNRQKNNANQTDAPVSKKKFCAIQGAIKAQLVLISNCFLICPKLLFLLFLYVHLGIVC